MTADHKNIPPWMDTTTLADNIGLHPNTIDNWVKRGLLPPPRVRGGKRLWKWVEVEAYLEGEQGAVAASAVDMGEAIYNATRKALEGH